MSDYENKGFGYDSQGNIFEHRHRTFKEMVWKEGKHAYGRVAFWYSSGSGFNFRAVDVSRFHSGYEEDAILGYCRLRGEERAFKSDKMQRIVDMSSGKSFSSIKEWADQAPSTPVPLPFYNEKEIQELGQLKPELSRDDLQVLANELVSEIEARGKTVRCALSKDEGHPRVWINFFRPKVRGEGEVLAAYIDYEPYEISYRIDDETGEKTISRKERKVLSWEASSKGKKITAMSWTEVREHLLPLLAPLS